MDFKQHAQPETGSRARYVPQVSRVRRVFLLLAWLYWLPPVLAWVIRLVKQYQTGMLTVSTLGTYVRIDDPPELLLGIWPVLLAGLLLKTGWPQLLLAAMVCAFAFGIADLAQAGLASGLQFPTNSFWRVLGFSRISVIGFMSVRGLLALFVGYSLFRCRAPWKRATRGEKGVSSQPPAIGGRLSLIVSGILAVAVIANVSWIAFTYIGLRDPWLRRLLAGPVRPQQNAAAPLTKVDPDDQRVYNALNDLEQADVLTARGQPAEARRLFGRGLNSLSEEPNNEGLKNPVLVARARGLNNLAWLLCTSEDRELRNPQLAVELAKKAVEIAPQEGNYWNTLGVAWLEAGDFEEARTALEKSMSLREGGGPHDWLFLAQVEWKVDHPNEARRWFERSEERLLERGTRDQELRRFYAETAQLIGASARELPRPSRERGDQPPAIFRGMQRSPADSAPDASDSQTE